MGSARAGSNPAVIASENCPGGVVVTLLPSKQKPRVRFPAGAYIKKLI